MISVAENFPDYSPSHDDSCIVIVLADIDLYFLTILRLSFKRVEFLQVVDMRYVLEVQVEQK